MYIYYILLYLSCIKKSSADHFFMYSIFAIIDDNSRFIVGYGISPEKTSDFCISILKNTIQHHTVAPFIYWSDNGGENIADDMQAFLAENDIFHIRTAPRQPQSNGKIERFWSKLQKFIQYSNDWDEVEQRVALYIHYYNNVIPHNINSYIFIR